MNRLKYKAVLFDLDGTLVDTAPDLASALNHLLIMNNKSPMEFDDIRRVASDGAQGIIQLGFGINDFKSMEFKDLRKEFIHYYLNHIADRSALFEGMEDVLAFIESANIPWGIVTNKPTNLTTKLLQALNLDKRTNCVVCGDTLPERKPHPEPLLYAAKILKLSPEDCCYVGDAERDIQASKAAKMRSVLATYGYLHANIDITAFGADYIIQSPSELRTVL